MDPFFEKNLITTKEAGELFGYTSDYLARLARGGKISGKRIGHSWLVDTESLTRFLSQQEDRKADYARTLAREREAEYRKHHSVLNDVSKTLSKPLPVSPLIEKLRLMVPQAVALSAATLVVTSGMFLAHAAPLASFTAEAALIARETAVGFDATFGNIPARVAARVDTVEKDARAISPRVAASTTRATERVASPVLIALQAELGLLQQRSGNSDFRDGASVHRLAAGIMGAGYAQPAPAPGARTAFDTRAFARGALALLVSPTQMQDSLVRSYRALGETGNRAIHASLAAYGTSIRHAGAGALALAASSRDSLAAAPRFVSRVHLASGSAIIGVTHAAIRAEVAAAYGLSAALPAAGQGATALMLGTGDALATATADTVVRTPVVLARALHTLSEAGPALAQTVFSAEYAVAAPFVRGAHALSGGYLATVTTAGQVVHGGAARSTALARAARSAAARTPAALEDAYLGALGKSALALETIAREPKVAAVLDALPVRALRGYGEAGLAAVAPVLSISERAALATYQTIRDLFTSANRALATLVGPAPSIVIPSGIPKPRVITVTPKEKLPSGTSSSAPSVSYPSYTTVVRGVSEEYVSQSLASLRGDVLATVSGMIQPVRTQVITNATTIQQVNKIEDLSNLIVRNGDFRGSIFDSGIRVSAIDGNFTNLVGATTTLATTTITGSLALTGDQTITGSLTISALTVTGSLSTSGSLTGGSIIASSATATSTFAGSLNVDSGGLVYATSTRNVGIGVLSPAALLAITNSTSTQPIFVASNAAGTEVYRITNAGFVGIGTTSPAYALAVEGSSTLGNQAIAGYFTATSTTADSTFPNLVATNSTTTNATTTSLYASALVAGDATSTNLYASSFTAGNATSTYAFATTASSTSLFATAARFATLVMDGLSTFGGGFLANASSTITSGLFTMGGGASTTNLTASGTGYFGSLGGAAVSALTANYLPKWNNGTFANSLVSDDGVRVSFPYASTTQLSAYGSLAVGGTATTSIVGDYSTSSLRGALAVYGNTTSGSASALTLQRGSTNGDNTLAFNDQTGSPLLKLYTSANTGYSYLTGYQSYLSLGTSVGGESLRIDTSDNIDLTAHLLPTANQQYDLGSPSVYWRNAYINNIVANNLSSASTSIAGTNTTSFSINSNNPTVDTQDMSLIFYRGAGAPSNAVLSWNSTLKRFEFNQNAYLTNAAASTASTTLKIAGVAGQTAPLTAWLDSSGSTLGTFTAGGSLGIGTSSPFAALSIAGAAGGTANLFAISTSTAGFATSTALTIDQNGDLALLNGANLSVSGGFTVSGATTFSGSLSGNGQNLTLARIGNSTYSTVQNLQDIFHSAGWVSGGTISDNGDGTASVTAGTGLIRATDSSVATISYFDWAQDTSVTLTDNSINFIYARYNAGSPDIVAATSRPSDYQTNVVLGSIYRSGTTLHIYSEQKDLVGDHAKQMLRFNRAIMSFAHESGGMISQTGTRNIALTAGAFWNGLNRFTTAAIDTSGADTFFYFYRDGAGGWTEVASQTQIDNTQYDDGDGGLGILTAARYGVHWVYLESDGHVDVVYGQGDYTLAQAQAATRPSSLPSRISNTATIVGKIIIQKSAASFFSVESSFETEFNPAGVTSHADLSNLAWTVSGHTGTANTIPYFNASGAAAEFATSTLNIGGNAATATALLNARTIGGVSFNGTADITVASATGGFTVSGGDLALGANSLTMTGSLGATGARLTKGWFTDLEVTNAIAGSITGNAGTVTNGVYTTDTGTVTNTMLAGSIAASKLSLAKGNFLVGNDAGTAQATSSIFVSSTGSVGIGSAIPESKLHVVSAAVADGNENIAKFGVGDAASFFSIFNGTGFDSSFAPTFVGYQADAALHNREALKFAGRVNPLNDVATAGEKGAAMQFFANRDADGTGNTPTDLQYMNAFSFGIYDSGNWTSKVVIDKDGNVGIGTTTPTLGNLQVATTDGSTAIAVSNTSGDERYALNVLNTGGWTMYDGGTGSFTAGLSQYQGKVGVGTSSPLSLFSIGTAGNAFRVDTTGTVKEGIWNGTTVAVGYGGTGQTSFTSGNLLYGAGSGALQNVATSSLSLGLGLSGSNMGYLVGGSSPSLSIATSSLYSGTTGQFPYFSGTNTLTATSSLFLATSGNVGIGTTTPSYKLDVLGGTTGSLRLANTNATPYALMINNLTYGFGDTKGLYAYQANDGTGRIGVNNDPQLVLSTNGNVGIGTTSPATLLHINNPADSDFLTISQGGSWKHSLYNYFNTGGNSRLDFKIALEAGTQATVMSLKGNGNVGIGTTSPASKLSIDGTGTLNYITFSNSGTAKGYLGISNGASNILTGDAQHDFVIRSTNNVLIGSGGDNVRVYVKSTGNVGIGTTTPSEKLQVVGGIRSTGPISAHGANHITMDFSSGGRLLSYGSDASTAGTFAFISRSSDASINNTAMTILGSGNVGIGTTNPGGLLGLKHTGGGNVSDIHIEDDNAVISSDNHLIFQIDSDNNSADRGFYFMHDGKGYSNGDYLMAIQENGNVGIGTTGPLAKLHVDSVGNIASIGGGSAHDGDLVVSGTNSGEYQAATFVNSNSGATASTTLGWSFTGTTPANLRNAAQILVGKTNDWSTTALQTSFMSFYTSPGTGGIAERVRIDKDGNVGIGTASPGVKLHVLSAGTQNSSLGDVSSFAVEGTNQTTSYTNAGIYTNTAAAADVGGTLGLGGLYRAAVSDAINYGSIRGAKENGTDLNYAGYLAFSTRPNGSNLTEAMRITSTGNVGIGTTGPGAALEIERVSGFGTTLGASRALILNDGGGGAGYRVEVGMGFKGAYTNSPVLLGTVVTDSNAYTASDFYIATRELTTDSAAIERMRITKDGNVGIGTTTPTAKLDINYNGGTILRMTNTPGEDYTNIDIDSAGDFIMDTYGAHATVSPGQYLWKQAGSEKMRLKAGNLGIGTSTPQNKLSVSGTSATLGISGAASGAGNVAYLSFQDVNGIQTGSIEDGSGANSDIYITSTAGNIIIAGTGGSCSLTGAASGGTCFSDETLKNVQDSITGVLGGLSAIQLKTFYWNDLAHSVTNASTTILNRGFIAQDVERVFPELVHTNEDGYKTLDYGSLGLYAIEGIKELNSRTKFIESAATSTVLTVDVAGNVGIGTSTPNRALSVAGDIGATGFVNTSTRNSKTDITYATESSVDEMFGKLLNLKVATYRYAAEKQNGSLRLGLIAEDAQETAPEILSADGKGVDLYKLATLTLSGVQALAAKVDGVDTRMVSLETRVDALENGSITSTSSALAPLSSSTFTGLASALEGFGVLIQKGIAQFQTLVFRELVASKDADGTSSAGSVSILAGNTVAQVANALVKPTTKVFVTFNSQIAGSWWVSDKQEGSFRIVLSEAQAGDVSFDYFLVQTEGALAASAPDAGGSLTSTQSASQTSSADKTPPTITLLGDNPLYLSTGGEFVEPGVQVTDDSGSVNPVVIYVDGVQQDTPTAIIDTASAATHIITYAATDAAGNLATAQRSVVVGGTGEAAAPAPDPEPAVPSDVEPPVVTLLGDAAVELTVGGTFIDLGATATDPSTGSEQATDLTSSIVVTGTVDTATAGLYTLTYSATDAAGNTGSASRVVTVVASATP